MLPVKKPPTISNKENPILRKIINFKSSFSIKPPEHTFYVDNLVAYQPLPFVKKILYLNLDLYHYFIGREDQSVNEKVMITSELKYFFR